MKHFLRISLLILSFNSFSQEQNSEIPKDFFEYEIVYSALPWSNVAGGVKPGFVYMDNVDVSTSLYLGKLLNWDHDLTFFFYGLGNHGGSATALMGDFQTASNIETPPAWRLYEAWCQYNLLDDRISLLLGLYDLNSEFDVLKPGALFVNSSFGIGAEYAQTGVNGPSIFAISSLALRLTGVVGTRLQWRIGIMDGVPGDPNDPTRNNIRLSSSDGALISTEFSFFTNSPAATIKEINEASDHVRHKKVGRQHDHVDKDKINFGAWYYTASFEEIGEIRNSDRDNLGAYIGYQKYHGNWSFFGRYGVANHRYNRFGSALSAGAILSNISRKWEDQLGLAFTSGLSSRNYNAFFEHEERAETAIELTYSILPTGWLNIQPDVQYVINPDTQSSIKNALAVALLIQVAL